MNDAAAWIAQVKNASIAGLLGAILFASYSGFWVWGTEYAKLERDRDEWKQLAMKAAHLIDGPPTYGSPPPAVRDLKRSIDAKLTRWNGEVRP